MDEKIINKSIIEFKEQAVQKYSDFIDQIYLFGSCARGDYDNESDIDVLVIVDTSASSIRECKNKLLDISSDIGLENNVFLSLVVSEKEEWDKNKDFSLLYKNVLSEGVRYYG